MFLNRGLAHVKFYLRNGSSAQDSLDQIWKQGDQLKGLRIMAVEQEERYSRNSIKDNHHNLVSDYMENKERIVGNSKVSNLRVK